MKGLITRAMTAICLTGSLTAAGGCCLYRDMVDPCWPERYNHAARQSVCQAVSPQVRNGHVLDQTMWNYHFEKGTDKLTEGGKEHLTYLIRRRPQPDPVVFLAAAQDVGYDPAAPEKLAENRVDLDRRRLQAIQNYLGAQASGRNVDFQVVVHDPAEPSANAAVVNATLLGMPLANTQMGQRVFGTAPAQILQQAAGSGR